MMMKRCLICALFVLWLFTPAELAEDLEAVFEAQLAENLAIQEEFSIQVCVPMLGGMGSYQVAYFEKLKAQAETDGNVNSTFLLAECYQYGTGTEEDWAQAFYWYTVCAEQGDASGQYALAECYEYGMGTEKDLEKALEYYQKAAEQGDSYAKEACFRLHETELIETSYSKKAPGAVRTYE